MKKVLIVGATGQLGTKVFEKLAAAEDYALRILVRKDSSFDHLRTAGPEIVTGDLLDPDSIDLAVEDCDVVIATANAIIPRKKEDTFEAVDVQGYRDLIDAAKRHGVDQFIYVSANAEPSWAKEMPLAAFKTKTENYLKASGLPYTIFQPEPFMDIYFAYMGTPIPLKDEVAPTVNRPFAFSQNFFKGIKDNIEKGKFGVIGNPQTRHSYITIDNVADFIVRSVGKKDLLNTTRKLGGPEALSGNEVKAIFEKVLNKPLKIQKTPAFLMKAMGRIFSLFNPPAANIFKMNYTLSTHSTEVDSEDLARQLSIDLTTAEEYLRSKVEA